MDIFKGHFSKFFPGNNLKTAADVGLPRERRTRALPLPRIHSRHVQSKEEKRIEDKPSRPLPMPKNPTIPSTSKDTEESSIIDAERHQIQREKVRSLKKSIKDHNRSRSNAIRDERRKILHTEGRPSSMKNRPTEGIENELQQIKKKHVTIKEPEAVFVNHSMHGAFTPRIDISWPENETLKRTTSFKWEDLKAVAAEKQRIETEKRKANMAKIIKFSQSDTL